MPVWDWIKILAFNLDLDWICFICSFACNASRVALCLLPHWQRASAPRAPLWSQRWQGLGRPASLAVHDMLAFWCDSAELLRWDKISQRLRNAQNGTLAYGALNSTDYFSCTIIYWFKKKTLFVFIWSNTFPVSPFQVQRHMWASIEICCVLFLRNSPIKTIFVHKFKHGTWLMYYNTRLMSGNLRKIWVCTRFIQVHLGGGALF